MDQSSLVCMYYVQITWIFLVSHNHFKQKRMVTINGTQDVLVQWLSGLSSQVDNAMLGDKITGSKFGSEHRL